MLGWLRSSCAAAGTAAQLEQLLAAAEDKLEQLQRQFERFVPSDVAERLADAGNTGVQLHPEAARIALMMHQRSARLFGGSFPASAAQRSRWLALSLGDADATATP
ncbi:MAG: hypothetical protein ABIS28_03725 [Caldimonas sp.]